MKWKNMGVGKVYKPYVLRFFLIDQNDKVVYTSEGKSDPYTWLPGEIIVKESIDLKGSLKKGVYKLALALENKETSQPSFRLAIDTPQINGLYVISKLILK